MAFVTEAAIMTIKQFAERSGVSEETARGWFCKKYIPGAVENDGVIFVPDSARRPYTHKGKREKKQEAIIKAVLKACNENCSVCAAWFHLDETTFQALLNGMVQGNLIQPYTAEDGIIYYNLTANGVNQLKQWSNKAGKEIWKTVQAFLPPLIPESLKYIFKI